MNSTHSDADTHFPGNNKHSDPAADEAQLAKSRLRREVRSRRRALSTEAQQAAASELCARLTQLPVFQDSSHIAFFIAADGEVNLDEVIRAAIASGKHCYLPAIDADDPGRLCFRAYQPGDVLQRTALGVLEPGPAAAHIDKRALDLVLSPLVAFDQDLNRMGMGKGFYDKTFAFKREQALHTPRLLGVAHECQRVDKLATEWWDVPLDGVVTPERLYTGGVISL